MTESVAGYYDANTSRFLKYGGGGDSYAIHRQLWGPGVSTAREASNYVNGLLAEEIRAGVGVAAPTVLDLGCGVGGTVFELAERLPGSLLHGVTISPRQRDLAERIAGDLGVSDRCVFNEADFETLRLEVRSDAILAVESFVHGRSPDAFFRTVASHLRPGGRMILVDDFLARPRDALDAATLRRVGAAEVGWRLSSLGTVEDCLQAAESHGLRPVKVEDLTPLVRLGRPRDRLVACVAPLAQIARLGRFPFFANLIGGHAINHGLRDGWLAYRMLVLELPVQLSGPTSAPSLRA